MNQKALRVIAPVAAVLMAACSNAQTPTPTPTPAEKPAAPAQPAPPAPPAPPTPATPPAAPPAAQPVHVQPVNNPPFGMFKDAKLPMIQRSVLTNVAGRIDHMAVDLVSNRLFVAARSNGSLEMLDIATSKQQPAINGLAEPASVLVVSDRRKLVLSCGGDNSVQVFTLNDQGDPTLERKLSFEGETDPVRYDAAAAGGGRVYVGHGKKLGSFDLATGERGPSLELPGMPEGFVIDLNSNRIFVNIAQAGSIAVVERTDKGELKLASTWALKDLKGNNPMAMDPASGHLFVVCRNPARFVVLDSKSGEQLGAMEVTDDADDCWWDAVLKRVYVSCGGNGGFVDVYAQTSENGKVSGYNRYHQERTNVGCRTSVFVPEQRRLIVAAPQIGTDPTFLYIFFVGP